MDLAAAGTPPFADEASLRSHDAEVELREGGVASGGGGGGSAGGFGGGQRDRA